MKEKLKDRIDVLFEKAKAGDNEAQLKLAKCFYRGNLVEKSIDQAKYWAFKSVSSGNMSAQGFYNELLKTKKDKVTDAFTYLITILTILPYIEIIIGLAVMIIANIIGYGDSIVASLATACFGIGIVSMFVSFGTGKIGDKFITSDGYIKGSSVGVIIVHVVGIYLLL